MLRQRRSTIWAHHNRYATVYRFKVVNPHRLIDERLEARSGLDCWLLRTAERASRASRHDLRVGADTDEGRRAVPRGLLMPVDLEVSIGNVEFDAGRQDSGGGGDGEKSWELCAGEKSSGADHGDDISVADMLG